MFHSVRLCIRKDVTYYLKKRNKEMYINKPIPSKDVFFYGIPFNMSFLLDSNNYLDSKKLSFLKVILNEYYKRKGMNKTADEVCKNIIEARALTGSFSEFMDIFSSKNHYKIPRLLKILFYIRIIFKKNKYQLYIDFIIKESAKILLDSMTFVKSTRIIQCFEEKTVGKNTNIYIREGLEGVFEDSVIDIINYTTLCRTYIEDK